MFAREWGLTFARTARVAKELGIHVITREVAKGLAAAVGGANGHPEGSRGLGPADKFTLVLLTAGLNSTEVAAYCPRTGPIPRSGGLLAAGRAGCQCTAAADDRREKEPGETPPAGPAGDLAAGFSEGIAPGAGTTP
jgi:hypothetical protein